MRREAVAFGRWAAQRGQGRAGTARHLGVRPATLRRWQTSWQEDHLAVRARGRPPARAAQEVRQEIVRVLEEEGPGVGLPTLQVRFPQVAREELREMQQRYRRVLRKKKRSSLYVLRWTRPGTVWAMDHADADHVIEGRYSHLFAVRDLAGQQQLAGAPVEAQDAVTAISVLEGLVQAHGAPLVLKSDNGSALRAGVTKDWARRRGILMLFSPPRTPSYNGSIEAGIGALKSRMAHHAARAGRPGQWTLDDVAAAVVQHNETGRPWGVRRETPQETWRRRVRITAEEREAFQRSVRRHYVDECSHRGLSWSEEHPHFVRAAIDRKAIQRALIEGGYLEVRRRRIAPPNTRESAIRIP